MKRYLMRATTPIFEDNNIESTVILNTIGGNSGNLLFPYSVCRNIMDDDVEVTFYNSFKESDAEWINNNFDAFLIPLANAFRIGFEKNLKKMIALIKKVKIPCIVIGVGWQTLYEPDLTRERPYDETALEFCNEILDRSKSIGVRGEYTAEYLKYIGVSEDKIDIIGCPSMFMYGDYLPLRENDNLTPETRITISLNGKDPELFSFLKKCKSDYPNYTIVLQHIDELRMLYSGDIIDKTDKNIGLNYFGPDRKDFLDNKLRFFINVPSWLKDSRQYSCDIIRSTLYHYTIRLKS